MAQDNSSSKDPKNVFENTGTVHPQDTMAPGQVSPKDDLNTKESAPQEDFNSTMMAIDVSKLHLDTTKTGLKIPTSSTPEEISKTEDSSVNKAPAKPSWWTRLKNRFLSRGGDKSTLKPRKLLPERLRRFQNIWFADPNEAPLYQIGFYLLRLLIVGLSLFLQILFIKEIGRSFAIAHPASQLFLMVFAIQLLLIGVGLFFRNSPTWVLAWPAAALALIMAYGALYYHTADPLYFAFGEKPISDLLNGFYLGLLLYGFVLSAFVVARNTALKIFFALFYLLALTPILLNVTQHVPLEFSFFGPGFLRFIPFFYLQPIYLLLHVLIPFLVLILLVFSFIGDKTKEAQASRGASRSLLVLFLCVLVLNFALMQKNRVFHALNFVFPKSLNVGGIEVNIFNQNLKIETRNFKENEGLDEKARYRFRIEKAREKNKFVLKLLDEFNFPVKFITKDDLAVYSDATEIKDYDLVEEDDPKLESGRYLLTLKIEAKNPLVKWTLPKQNLTTGDQIVFQFPDPAKIDKFLIKREEDTLLEVAKPQAAQVSLPLSYFQTGAHKITALIYDELGQEIFHEDISFSLTLPNDFAILSPLPDDLVQNQANVLLQLKGLSRDSVQNVTYLINGQPAHQAEGMTYFHTLDLSTLPEGPVQLAVKVKTPDKEWVHEVSLKKQTTAPRLLITEPSMGVFAERNTPVSFQLSDANQSVQSVRAWVNGVEFPDVALQGNRFELPTARWQESEIYLALQATLANGEHVSDWVQVNRGLSVLSLAFDTKTLNFLNVNKVAIILDASVSSWDNWQGKSKWFNMTNVVLAPDVESRLKNLNPTFVVFGSEKPFYFDDCSDVDVLSHGSSYNKATIKRKVEEITPKGVSALVSALKKAYSAKPEKVFLFTDSADSCKPNLLAALKPVFAKSPQTVVNVFSLGRVLEHDRKQLIELAEKTGGRYFQPDEYEALLNSWLKELSLNYELSSQEKQIYQSPLEDKEFRLAPGSYTLKIPYGNQVKEVELKLDHSTKTTLTISGKTQGQEQIIQVDQVVTQL